jgi:hypothetical protein
MSNLTEYVKSLPACPEGKDCPLGGECDLYHHHKKDEECWYIANKKYPCPRTGCNGKGHDNICRGLYACWFGEKCTQKECPGFHVPKGKSLKSISTLKKINPQNRTILKATSTLRWEEKKLPAVEEKKNLAEIAWGPDDPRTLNLNKNAIDPKDETNEEEFSSFSPLEDGISALMEKVDNLETKSKSDDALIKELRAQLQNANDQIAPLQEKVKTLTARFAKITSLVNSGLKK